jgi:hypothetical protein
MSTSNKNGESDQALPPTDPVQYVLAIQAEARQRELLSMWTVYDHPKDFPNNFVARCFVVSPDGPQPTENFVVSPTLKALRMMLRMSGLSCMQRAEGDDAKIVETWL